MTQEEAKQHIAAALQKAKDADVEFTLDTDLYKEEILDSLDSMLFFLTLEELTGVKFPETDLGKEGFSRIGKIVDYLVEKSGT